MDALKSSNKSFDISKREVQEAYEKVKANKGAPGVDGCSIEDFEKDLKNNLYRVWNRMSSGSYFPPPVKAVEQGHRSLSVGDVIGVDGSYYACAAQGWDAISTPRIVPRAATTEIEGEQP